MINDKKNEINEKTFNNIQNKQQLKAKDSKGI